MDEKLKALDAKLNQLDAKLNKLLNVAKTDEKEKQETIKLQIQLEQMRMDHERQMRDEAWKREDKIRAENKKNEDEKMRFESHNRGVERNHELDIERTKLDPNYRPF